MDRGPRWNIAGVGLLLWAGLIASLAPASVAAEETAAERGYRWLTTKPYLPIDFDQETFDDLWQSWEEPARSQAAKATAAERRQMAFSRYGLTDPPAAMRQRGNDGQPLTGVAWQYVDDRQGGWVMNCLACHGGKVAGHVIPGLPNSHYALETLTEDVLKTKLRQGKTPGRMEAASLFMPLGGSIGTTNAVNFGTVLMAFRDPDLSVHLDRPRPVMLHHDHDAPPWWNVRKKKAWYADGFAAPGHRALMQFLLIPKNGPERFHEWENDFRDVLAWIESLEAPRYPWEIDQPLAEQGRTVFEQTCARCHGTYGPQGSYPNRIVPIDGTDPLRLEALSSTQRAAYEASWFSHFGAKPALHDPTGYVATPLDGVWATAPYFHNGSVPTLWHVLHTTERPWLWSRTEDGYDRDRVGLEAIAHRRYPDDAVTPAAQRRYFDARKPGKSIEGHDFAEALQETERRAVLEYLKTL